jgi:flagellar biosynthesis chaperone FliJ
MNEFLSRLSDWASSDTLWAVVGAIAAVAATCVAIIELVRRNALDRQFTAYRRVNANRIWGHIQIVLEAYETLDEAKKAPARGLTEKDRVERERFLCDKIISARKAVVAAYLRLLEQAISEQDRFDEQVAQRWLQMGRLENDWRYRIAMKFVD